MRIGKLASISSPLSAESFRYRQSSSMRHTPR